MSPTIRAALRALALVAGLTLVWGAAFLVIDRCTDDHPIRIEASDD